MKHIPLTWNPKVSVIMGIYNCEQTLREALDSVCRQTYSNWELILWDDGSTDGTYEIAKQYETKYPDRIRVFHDRQNHKLSHALNQCLRHAKGELIARMDGDDLSHPKRLEKQVRYLQTHPDIDLVGTQMKRFDENGYTGIIRAPMHPKPEMLRSGVPIHHATILTYRSVYETLNGYTESEMTEGVEDVDLWFRFYEKGFKAETLDEALYDVRMNQEALKRRTLRRRIRSIRTRAAGYKRLGFPRRWLIVPACKLVLKGLVPMPARRIYANVIQKNRKDGKNDHT